MTRLRFILRTVLLVAFVVGACSAGGVPETTATSVISSTTTTLATTTLATTTTTIAPPTTPAPTTATIAPPPTLLDTATLTIETVVNEDGSGGSFIARGSDVDSGRFCAEGVFVNLDFDFDADPNWFEDAYTCEGKEGTLAIRVESPVPDEQDESDERQPVLGTWTVSSATGDWEGTSGGGNYRATFNPWAETYAGNLESG